MGKPITLYECPIFFIVMLVNNVLQQEWLVYKIHVALISTGELLVKLFLDAKQSSQSSGRE